MTTMLAALVVAPPTDAATREQRLAAQVNALRSQNAVLSARAKRLDAAWRARGTTLQAVRGERDAVRASLVTAQSAIATLQEQLTAKAGEATSLAAQLATRTTERDNALAGLPAAISAVPLASFWSLVFTPARAAWPCDSYYSSGGYWSLTFDSSTLC